MTHEIKWTAGNGSEITMTVESRFELNRQGREKTSGRKEVVTTATVNGERHSGLCGVQKIDHPAFVAKFGKIGLTEENYERLHSAREAVEAEISEHNTACDRHADEMDAVTAESRRIETAMRCGDDNDNESRQGKA